MLLAQRLGQLNACRYGCGDDHADDALKRETHEQQAHDHDGLAHDGTHYRGGTDGDAKDRIGAGKNSKTIAQAYAREDDREEVAAAPAHIDEGGVTSCLKEATRRKLDTLAFCCISTGVFGYPQQAAARVAIDAVRHHLDHNDPDLKVIFNVFLASDESIYRGLLQADR